MKKLLTLALLATFGLAAQAPAKTSRAKRATHPAVKTKARKTSKPKAVVIPKDAVAQSDGTYAWKDSEGKDWVFIRTPFGVMKTAAQAGTAKPSPLANAKAIDAGDKVRFETATPFGVITREKNKADLTDEERKLYITQNPGQLAPQE
jgi:hypothetical protein